MKTKMDFPNINQRKPEGLREDGKAFRVLIVDDSMFVTKQIGQILTSEGFDPKVDLVTMDITMPIMDGVAALEKIIEFDKNANIIMISALGKQDLVKKSLLLGAKNYIVKPLDRKKVLERVMMTLK